MLFSDRFSLTRPSRMRACSRIGSRPTSSGGGEPAPGEKGFLIGSISSFLYPFILKAEYTSVETSHSHPEHLHDLVAQVVDDLDGDPAGARLLKGARGVAGEGGPGVLVDLGAQGRFQRLVRVLAPRK